MVLYGVNVINANENEIISAYKKIINIAHKRNILIYAGTIMPFSQYKRHKWTLNKEKVRTEVNNWIRNTKPEDGGFDAFFDYDYFLKDPLNETRLNEIYDSGDGIHPSTEGLKKMVETIKDFNLFIKSPQFQNQNN